MACGSLTFARMPGVSDRPNISFSFAAGILNFLISAYTGRQHHIWIKLHFPSNATKRPLCQKIYSLAVQHCRAWTEARGSVNGWSASHRRNLSVFSRSALSPCNALRLMDLLGHGLLATACTHRDSRVFWMKNEARKTYVRTNDDSQPISTSNFSDNPSCWWITLSTFGNDSECSALDVPQSCSIWNYPWLSNYIDGAEAVGTQKSVGEAYRST